MIKYIAIFSLMMFICLCQADEISDTSKQEIEHLFSFLENSGCQFNRNGSWYSASEAVAHIRKKYTYLVGKKMLTDTESFIEKAASESSLSGKAYLVKCEGRPEITSAIWFMQELEMYRAARKSQN